MTTPTLDEYEALVGHSTVREPFVGGTAQERRTRLAGRAQAIARRVLIERHRSEYDRLYYNATLELQGASPVDFESTS